MQTWTLARYTPLIIGDKIPEDCTYWETFLTLLDIMDICFSPYVTKEQLTCLTALIESHHQSYKECYPEKQLIPKQHYMIHYRKCIKRYIKNFIQYMYLNIKTDIYTCLQINTSIYVYVQIWPTSSLLVYAI